MNTDTTYPTYAVDPARPHFDEHGDLHSALYNDRYKSSAGAIDEARSVFLHGNDLPTRWRARERFCIGELGFGTGTNFLVTWDAWENDPHRCTHLHYIAFEAHPLPLDDLSAIHARWHTPRRDRLIAAYPPPARGFHRRAFAGGRVVLTLILGPAETMLDELDARCDAWYLDGFAPARNPALWQAAVLERIAALTNRDGTLSTYTVAGTVRRTLQSVGFEVQKRPGFGLKRQMLHARLRTVTPPARNRRSWLDWPAPPPKAPLAVIGAGLAGAFIAQALARRGWPVDLYARTRGGVDGASGIAAAVVQPRLEQRPSPYSRFALSAYTYAVDRFTRDDSVRYAPIGALHLGTSAKANAHQRRVVEASGLAGSVVRSLNAAEASALAGVSVAHGGTFYPQAGWYDPREALRSCLATEGVSSYLGTTIAPLTHDGSQWCIESEGTTRTYSGVVIAAGHHSEALLPPSARSIPASIVPARGQTTVARLSAGATDTLRTVLCYGGYIAPLGGGDYLLGASFERDVQHTHTNADDDVANRLRLRDALPALAARLDGSLRPQHVGIRATTRDRLALLGPLTDLDALSERFVIVENDRSLRQRAVCPHLPGLYIASGLGTHGASTAPLLAEVFAAHCNGEPLPLEKSLLGALHPLRFTLKRLRRARR